MRRPTSVSPDHALPEPEENPVDVAFSPTWHASSLPSASVQPLALFWCPGANRIADELLRGIDNQSAGPHEPATDQILPMNRRPISSGKLMLLRSVRLTSACL